MTNKELNELLEQRKAELQDIHREMAEEWLTKRMSRKQRRKRLEYLETISEQLGEAEELLFPLITPKVGF